MSPKMMAKKFVAKAVHPWLALRLRGVKARRGGERELRLLDLLCERDRAAIDVGANKGIYTLFCRHHSAKVYAIEALPSLQRQLERSFHRKVEVLQLALSDQHGTATIRVPFTQGTLVDTRGSLEQAATDSASVREIEVPTRRLDELNLRNIGFIKIDVEGHELNVLRGALETLRRESPVLLVEAEERHRPGCTRAVFDLLEAEGYSGWFLDGSRLRPVSEFSVLEHQNPQHVKPVFGKRTGAYLNNFIFVPGRRANIVPKLEQRAQSL